MLEIFISGSWSPPCWSWPWWKWNPHLKSQVPGHHPALDGDEQVPHLPGQLAGGDRHRLRRTQVGGDFFAFFFRSDFWPRKKRGAVGFSLAAVLDDTSWYKELFLTTALAMVFFTVFVQGSTIKFLVRWHIWEVIILGCIYKGPSSVSVPKRKTVFSQSEPLIDSCCWVMWLWMLMVPTQCCWVKMSIWILSLMLMIV